MEDAAMARWQKMAGEVVLAQIAPDLRDLRGDAATRLRRAVREADAAGVLVAMLERESALRLWRAMRQMGSAVLPDGRLLALIGMTTEMGAYVYLTRALFADYLDGGLLQWRCAVIIESAWRASQVALVRSRAIGEPVVVQVALLTHRGQLIPDVYPVPAGDALQRL
jgi:hypothetical protein